MVSHNSMYMYIKGHETEQESSKECDNYMHVSSTIQFHKGALHVNVVFSERPLLGDLPEKFQKRVLEQLPSSIPLKLVPLYNPKSVAMACVFVLHTFMKTTVYFHHFITKSTQLIIITDFSLPPTHFNSSQVTINGVVHYTYI